jgi:transcriptional regulator with XRE-family HTH domain
LAQNQSSGRDTPEVMRRRLRAALRQEREAAGLTQREAAEALDWSVSKILRIEQGAVAITPIDLRALLAVYKTVDEQREAELVNLARGSRKQAWVEYKDVYSPASLTLFGYEAAAKIIYKYEPTFIPGILQTEEYARALLAGLGYSEGQIDLMVRARLERQELLDREQQPRLEFILDEACVIRPVGGERVMIHQLDRLKAMATRSNISLQVLPFSIGAHRRMGEAFTILQFADENLDDLLYLENAGGESVSQENPDVIARYLQDFFTLQSGANDASRFASTIDDLEDARLAGPAGVAKNGAERAPS